MRLLPYLQHSFWFLPNVAACHAMANLLAEKQNTFWHDYTVLVVAGAVGGHRARRAAAGAQGDRQRLRHQDHHALVRQAHHRRHRAAVVVDPDAAQPQVAGDLLPGRVPRAVAVVDQEPERRRPERGGDPQAGLLRVRLRAHARAAPALRLRHRPLARTSRTRRTPSRTSCRSCRCWPTTART